MLKKKKQNIEEMYIKDRQINKKKGLSYSSF